LLASNSKFFVNLISAEIDYRKINRNSKNVNNSLDWKI